MEDNTDTLCDLQVVEDNEAANNEASIGLLHLCREHGDTEPVLWTQALHMLAE